MNDAARRAELTYATEKQRRACGKVKYPSRKIARAVARIGERRDRRIWNAYRCSLCRGWHVGHSHRRARFA